MKIKAVMRDYQGVWLEECPVYIIDYLSHEGTVVAVYSMAAGSIGYDTLGKFKLFNEDTNKT